MTLYIHAGTVKDSSSTHFSGLEHGETYRSYRNGKDILPSLSQQSLSQGLVSSKEDR